jgi:site-specific recombinase XerD
LKTPSSTKKKPATKSKTSVAQSQPEKNRLTPIRESMQHMRGYPNTLVIYKTNASRYYWVRFYFQNKYRTKTTKTENTKLAKDFAIQFYKDTLLSSAQGLSFNKNKSFALVATHFFESSKDNSNESVFKNDFNRYKQHLLPEFKQQEIDTITNSQISQLVIRLQKSGLQPATVKHHLVVLRKIMKYAIANDLMKNLPLFPRISGNLQTAVKRDYFTQKEYDTLIKTTERLAQQEVTVRGTPITLEMKFLIQFMVNSFIRPSDLRVLKHKHVQKRHDKDSEWLELIHPATKTNANPVQAMPASVHIYDRLLAFRKERKEKVRLEDWVFFPQFANRNTAMGMVSRLFRRIVDESHIEEKTDKNLSLYSLRHTAIMFRLIIGGVDTLPLARNARTSQAMIDKFYAAHLTTEQVRKQLHAFPEAEEKARLTSAKKAAKKSSATPKKSSLPLKKKFPKGRKIDKFKSNVN